MIGEACNLIWNPETKRYHKMIGAFKYDEVTGKCSVDIDPEPFVNMTAEQFDEKVNALAIKIMQGKCGR